jgi:superfamily II DNA or RNA helicase
MVAPAPAGLLFELRDYQVDALARTATAEAGGQRSQLGVAATGLGKTVIFCALARERGGRALILAHRDELVSQAAAKIREVWPGVDVGIVKAGQDDYRSQVVVASVQTLARQSRLDRLIAGQVPGALSILEDERPFDLVIVDEAHHAAADTYRRIIEQLKAGTADGPLLLGVTATPDRGDGKGLDDLFDTIVWNYDILWGIRNGYLSDVRGKRVVLDAFKLDDVKISRGDYDAGSAGRALEAAQAPAAIVRAWREFAIGRRTLVFTPTVALAEQVSDAFRAAGHRAAWICGATPIDERRAILAGYANGEFDVLSNCAVLTEGYDEPRTDCVVVARPTKSRALYTQMVGRGTRRHPDKADLLVLDLVGATDDHSLVTVPSLFGIDRPEFTRKLGDGTALASDVVEEQADFKVRIGALRAQDAEMFRKVRAEGIAWVHIPGELRRYQRTQRGFRYRNKERVGFDLPTVALKQSVDGLWAAVIESKDDPIRVLIQSVSLEVAQGVGEDAVRRIAERAGSPALIDAAAPWRKRPPSPKALTAARNWRLPNIDEYSTAGELSDALDAHIAKRKRK